MVRHDREVIIKQNMDDKDDSWVALSQIDKDEKLTAHQQAYNSLRHAIMIGRISHGKALTIRGLATKLNVSPTPVREAIRRLSSEGALSVLDNRRVVVPQMDADRFEELIAFRRMIECYAAQSALPYVNDILVDKIEAVDAQMDEAIKQQDQTQTVILNQQFHSLIYTANINQVVMPSIKSIWLQLGPYSRIALTNLAEMYPIDHHKTAIKALRSRDLDLLKLAIADDIEDGIARCGRLSFNH